MTTRSRRWTRGAAAATAVAALGANLVSGSALGGLQARLDNTQNTAASATLLYTHSYGSTCTSVPSGAITDTIQTVPCTGSLYPASSAGASQDAITANGNVSSTAVTQTASAASPCGIVRLANTTLPTNPLLPRFATTFGTAGPYSGSTAITLDGSTAYTSAVVSETQPGTTLTLGASYGIGIWFKTNTILGGPIFSLGTSAANATSETFDRTLYMAANGQVGFIYETDQTSTPVSSTKFNDNVWHFAYANIKVGTLGLTATASLSVDGTTVGSAGGILSGLSSLAGYWHLGWSPATAPVPRQYFAGSAADLVVINNGTAPSAPLAAPSSQATYTSGLGTGSTDYWVLDDSGTTVLTSGFTLPVISTTAPCSYVDIAWSFTNPASCATTSCTLPPSQKLSAFAGTTATISTVTAGTTQIATLTLAHDAAYTGTAAAYIPGLIVYDPLTISFKRGTSAWKTDFTWTATASSFLL
jgi:hypothetical protein